MSEALERIRKYVDEFRESIERCRSTSSASLDLKNAYGALGRLRDRYKTEKERNHLTPTELAALQKALDEDTFIQGLMELRQVAEHVVVRGGSRAPEIRSKDNQPIHVTVECSALPVFGSLVVNLPTTDDKVHRLDHLESLETAERRIAAALAKAGL